MSVQQPMNPHLRHIAACADSLERMGETLAAEGVRLDRLDHARRLDALDRRVSHQVDKAERIHASLRACLDLAQAIGSFFARDANRPVHRMPEKGVALMDAVPVVMVGLLPGDVHVGTERTAGPAGRQLPAVDGERLCLSPADFHKLIQIVRERMLKGSLCLPVAIVQLASLLADGEKRD